MIVLVAYGHSNKLPQTWWPRAMNSSYRCKVWNQFQWPKRKCQPVYTPLEVPGDNLLSCLIHLLTEIKIWISLVYPKIIQPTLMTLYMTFESVSSIQWANQIFENWMKWKELKLYRGNYVISWFTFIISFMFNIKMFFHFK